MSVYKLLKDLVGDAKQGNGTIAFWVLYRLFGFRNCHYQCSSPDFWNFEVAQAGRKEATQPRTSVQLQHGLLAPGKQNLGLELFLVSDV